MSATMTTCAICSAPLDGKRSDAKTCGPTCRSTLRRRTQAAQLAAYRQIVADRAH